MSDILYYSTNFQSERVTFREALLKGQSPDKGLYMPEIIPQFSSAEIDALSGKQYFEIAFEVINKFLKDEIPPEDLRIEFSKSGGPGGQNVNKRETAVRIVHLPTNLSVHVTTERSQEQNRERGMEILKGKLYKKREEDKIKEKAGLSTTKTTEIEWGSQIRSYVLHPYKMIKDHRTDVEVRNIDSVLEDGMIDEFIEAEKNL